LFGCSAHPKLTLRPDADSMLLLKTQNPFQRTNSSASSPFDYDQTQKTRSALNDVVTREYTVHLHKRVHGSSFKKSESLYRASEVALVRTRSLILSLASLSVPLSLCRGSQGHQVDRRIRSKVDGCPGCPNHSRSQPGRLGPRCPIASSQDPGLVGEEAKRR
jgi:hypothetical protein